IKGHEFASLLVVLVALVVAERGAYLTQGDVLRLTIFMGVNLQRDGQPRISGRYHGFEPMRSNQQDNTRSQASGLVPGPKPGPDAWPRRLASLDPCRPSAGVRLPRQWVSVKMKSNSDPTGLPVAWSNMEPSAPAYLPVPPVMASVVLVPSSKKGPSTVRWPPGSRVVQVHSHSVLPVATVRMQEPLSVPICRVLDALYTGLWKPSTSPRLSLGGWNICTVSVIACSTTWMIIG